jgi:hypothetical protein
VAAPSPSKGTPVQTASSVLKSVPLLTSYNPARSSGGLAVIMGASSPTNAQLHGSGMDSPVSGGGGGAGGGLRKRSSTEVSRPNRRSGGLAGIAAGHMHLPPCSPRSNGAAMSGAAAAAARAPGGIMSPGGSGGSGSADGLAHARTLSIAEDEPPLDLSASSTA